MTDRELLELAAKAMGIKDVRYYLDDFLWNPFTNDSDALRMAVKLNLRIAVREYRTEVFHWRKLDPAVDVIGFELSEPIIKMLAKEDHDGDPYTTTRRAIVRAAAEIGKEMK